MENPPPQEFLHVIPANDEETPVDGQYPTNDSSRPSLFNAFHHASQTVRAIGSNIVFREAASINRQLLSQHVTISTTTRKRTASEEHEPDPAHSMTAVDSSHQKFSSYDENETPQKKRRTDRHVVQRAERLRRLSRLLQKAEAAQSRFLWELQTLNDDDHE